MIKGDPQNAPNVPGMLEKGQWKGLPVATPTFISLLLDLLGVRTEVPACSEAVRTEGGVDSPSRECS